MRRMHKSPVQDSNESSEECIHSLKSRANTDHLTEAPKQEEEDFVSREESTGLLPQSDKDIMAKERWYSTRTRVLFITHFNVFLYATCFWIQIGVLPVSRPRCLTSSHRSIHCTYLASGNRGLEVNRPTVSLRADSNLMHAYLSYHRHNSYIFVKADYFYLCCGCKYCRCGPALSIYCI